MKEIVAPSEVVKMNDSEFLNVNRIIVNARLVELRLTHSNSEGKEILLRALKSEEKDVNGSKKFTDVKMNVGDIKRVWPNIEKLPKNTFKVLKKT